MSGAEVSEKRITGINSARFGSFTHTSHTLHSVSTSVMHILLTTGSIYKSPRFTTTLQSDERRFFNTSIYQDARNILCRVLYYVLIIYIQSCYVYVALYKDIIYIYIFVCFRVPATFGTREILFEVLLHDDSASIHCHYYYTYYILLYGGAVYTYYTYIYIDILYTPILFNSSASETQPQRGIKLVSRALYIIIYTRNILQTSHIYLFSLSPSTPSPPHNSPPSAERRKNVTCNTCIRVYMVCFMVGISRRG